MPTTIHSPDMVAKDLIPSWFSMGVSERLAKKILFGRNRFSLLARFRKLHPEVSFIPSYPFSRSEFRTV